MNRRAIIVGHQGQDGTLLTKLLVKRGESVIGLGRGGASWITQAQSTLPVVALENPESIAQLIRASSPTHVYYLAAHHQSSEKTTHQALPGEGLLTGLVVNALGPIHFLRAIVRDAPACRFFYASSALIFGAPSDDRPLDESSLIAPLCDYGRAKAIGMAACRQFRREHGVHASVGILFNHESTLRPADFLSRKVIEAALQRRVNPGEALRVGSLDAVIDWGYAPDFVDAFVRITDLPAGDDFVVATGEAHRVREFVQTAFAHVGLDWRDHVVEDPTLLTRRPTRRAGNPEKLAAATGWRPSLPFEAMVRRLVDDYTHRSPAV